MSGAARRGATQALGTCLAVGALGIGVAACSTSSTVFGGNQSPLTGWIVLHQPTVRAGHLVRAELVLHNDSGHVMVLDRMCSFQFPELVLSRGKLTTGAFFPDPLCRPGVAFVARPGTTVYRLRIGATIGGCTMVGHQPAPGSPQCLTGNRMPPLPAGTYKLSIAAIDRKLQSELAIVQPVEVRVTRG